MGIPNRGLQLRAVAIFDCILGATSMILRAYTRGGLARTWNVEDWLMLGATITFLVNITTCLLGIHYGTGRHMTDLQPYDIEKAMLNWWLCYPTYAATMVLSKCSIGIFLNRLTPSRVHHWIMYIAMFLTSLTGVAFFFICIFQCSPISYWWKQIYPGTEGHCITIRAVINITYAYSAVAILTDFTFALLPIHIVMNLQMDMKTKLVLVPIFAMATIASVACAIRIEYLPKFTEGDFLWNTSDIVIWSETEQGLAITAGNLATLRPLFRLTVEKINSWTGRSPAPTSAASGNTESKRSTRKGLTPHSSRRNLFRKQSFSREIEVHTDVDIQRERTNIAEAYANPITPVPEKRRNQGAWFDSTAASKGDSDEEFHVRTQPGTYYNAV